MGHVVGGAADHVPHVMPGSPPMADHETTQPAGDSLTAVAGPAGQETAPCR
jgi:hypothetical protein